MRSQTATDRTIFLEAVQYVPPERWDAFVKDRCGGDSKLHERVHRLLAAHQDLGDFQEPDSASKVAGPTEATCGASVDMNIGPYKLREKIGEGGMGEVYVAEQTEPVRRKVALKIIKPGMASKDVVARFEAERQALAMMDHPNIASVLDGGATETGQSFFAMELVRGVPITEYCDRERLSTTERLQLFVKVCRAVQHAHQKGVIHRDIKPTNVLVPEIDGEAVPKVIDFGVAKAVSQKLTDQTVYTQFEQVIGTPLYMSPEQAGSGVVDIDTRSDIYSLGVLLYELLTGNTPFDRETLKQAGFDEFRRMLREDEPRRPSQAISTLNAEALSTISDRRACDPRKLAHMVSGDLDWIVMKALERDRSRRYETANGLAREIERYLNSEPVEACPPSIFYRSKKFAKRNRRTLIFGTLVASFVFVILVQYAVVTGQRNRQRRQLESDVGHQLTAADTALESNNLAAADQHLSRARGVLENSSQNHLQLSERLIRLTSRLETYRSDREQFAKLSRNYRQMWMLTDTRDKEAKSLAKESLGLFGVLDDPDWQHRLRNNTLPPKDRVQLKEILFETLLVLAYVDRKDRSEQGIDARLRYLDLAESFHEPIKSLYRLRRDVYADLGDDGNVAKMETLMEGTKCSTALDCFVLGQLTSRVDKNRAAAISCYEKAVLLEPNNFPSLFYLAYRLGRAGNTAEAARLYQACLALRPSDWLVLFNLGCCLETMGKYEHAVEFFRRALVSVRREQPTRDYQVLTNLGCCLKTMGKYQQAIKYFTQALASVNGNEAARVLTNRAGAYIEDDMYDEALADLNSAIELDSELFEAYCNRAIVHRHFGTLEEAMADCNRALELGATATAPARSLAAIYSNRGSIFFDMRQYERALEDIDTAIELQRANSELHCRRGWTLAAQERYDLAAASFSSAIELDPENSIAYWMAAWFRASCPDPAYRDPPRTLNLAQEAVELDERSAEAWGMLAFAQYRSGDHTSAIDSVSKALDLNDHADATLCLIAALVHQANGHHDDALRWYAQATEQSQKKNSKDKNLLRLRDEAAAELGLSSEPGKPRAEAGDSRVEPDQPEPGTVNRP